MLRVARGPEVSAYVVRRSASPQELRRALWGLLRTRELVPLLAAALATAALGAFGMGLWALIPLLLALVFVFRQTRGQIVGLGLYDDTQLVGGVRLRVDRRRVGLLGIYVRPSYRGQGAAKLLLAASLQEAARLLPGGKLVAYAPTHPASRRLAAHYLGGTALEIGSPAFTAACERLRG
jgi:GNAT superfamily N-acetyltransferase